MLKGIILSLALISGFCSAASLSGNIGVSLTILPSEGCSNKMCVVKSENVLKKDINKDFQVSKDKNLITVSF